MKRIVGVFVAIAWPLTGAIVKPVKVDGGLVQGVAGKDASITAFKGVPFAAPPVGDLRWRAPRPVVPWQGVRKAGEFGTSCVQNIVAELKPWTYEFMTHTDVSEDCLFLNVWTGAKAAGEKRPVYVYIHGGANTSGSGAVPVYDGEGLASKGVVVVTVNYRLGIFGFFAHPELTAESGVHSSGNYALLDLIAALQWVHRNIAAFGGNPDRVTIGGQSAGATDVHCLVNSPLAKGLFHGAIAESGSSVSGLGLMRATKLADLEKVGERFADAKGAHTVADLRKLSWKELTAPLSGGARSAFGIAIDGYVEPMTPGQSFALGKQNDVPTITGCNREDLGGGSRNSNVTTAAFERQAQRYDDLAAEFLKLYPATTDEQAKISANESAWDSERADQYFWALARAKTAKTKAYTYFWEHTLPGPESDRYGAFHTSEVPYVMNTLYMSDRPFTEEDRRIAATMSAYWVNFIRTGDPNGAGLAHWPSVSEQPGMTFEVGDRTVAIPVAGSKEKLAFFEQFLNRPPAAPPAR